MKPSNFDYYRPDNVDEAVSLLSEHGDDARVIAGGQSLMAMLNLRLAAADALIDISRLKELSHCREADGYLEVGAAVTQGELLRFPNLSEIQPLLAKALPNVGHFQTRNRGTVCGSIAHADPSSEIPLCLAALEGQVVLRSSGGERVIGAAEFQTGMLATAIEPGEMIAAARFPVARAGAGYAFAEVARRRGDFAIVGLAAIAQNGTLRLGAGGVAGKPAVAEWQIDPDQLDDALNAFAWEMGGEDDIHATAKYRRQIVRRLGRSVLEEARSCSN
ncbi:MAG: FAD binding domain-containing protein [Rhodospirillales bacterium]|jgi:2-furoyl-CoA dehydrogenase FAD binding subunit|nr:carbon monoxide dehydrogenase [Rhodospirillaceae bacterium]MDP6427940.1 FAD binding domain-containing protein [Rhodospirillales bacterium]MDP6646432.1 FAD binding domain-containing protein [Rhodospirillales bacterium]MDP6841070.1 FAD binding domain-containing protein [Rhodospirillales bacterium]